MPRPLLPPRGIFTGTRWLFDPALSPNIKETLLQLMALTWGRDGHTTPLLAYEELESLTGKDARTLRGHLAALRSYHAALRLQHAGAGQMIITLAAWLFRNDALPACSAPGEVLPQPGSFLPAHDHAQEELSESGMESAFLDPLDDHDQAGSPKKRPARKTRPREQPPARGRAADLSGAMERRLRQAGVFPALLPEVAARAVQEGYTEAQLTALLDWCADDQPDGPAALFIGRLRAGARAPAVYSSEACPECGQRGKHGPECRRRYLEGLPG